MKKKDIIEAVHERLGFSKRESARLVETTLDVMRSSLEQGEPVKISSFGKFSVRDKKERAGRMPGTDTPVVISARRVVTFKLSRVLRDAINEVHRD